MRRAWLPFVVVLALLGLSAHASTDAGVRSGFTGPSVVDARVWLTIYRGGETKPDGARVDPRGGWVEGVVEYRLERAARAGERLVLLDFAAFMREEPTDLDEVALATYLDGPFDPGATHVTGYWGATQVRRVGSRRDLVVELDPGARVVTLRYAVEVPHRYWPFGCAMRRCSLSGALAPLPSRPARGGRWLPRDGRVIAPTQWTVERAQLAIPGEVRPRAPNRRKRKPDEVIVVGGDGRSQPYPSVFWGPRWHRTKRIHHGVEIEVLHPRRRPAVHYPREPLTQLRRDAVGHAVEIAVELVELLEVVGLEQPVGTRMEVVQGPLRSGVAEAHPGVVMLSDQALELFPLDRFLKFHQEAIARAMLDMIALRTFGGTHDPSTDLWLSGMVGFALVQPWREARAHRDEFASDILRNFTFVPAVDRFLYTQQAAFSQTYFRGVEDEPPIRNHPLWFANQLPTGRRLHEKLSDTLDAAQLDSFYRSVARRPTESPRRLASQAYGYELSWFFDQWLGPYPSVDYAIADVRSQPRGRGWRHTIVIEQIGTRPVIEPVQVLVTERSGQRHYLVWNGELANDNETLLDEPKRGTHTFVLDTHAKIANVRLDPRNRLVQTPQPPRTNVDPRFNDRVPPKLRFLYTGAGLSVAASEFVNAATPTARLNAINGFISFEGSLRRDLRRTGHVLVAKDRETNIAAGAGANFWLGRKRNMQRRRSRIRTFLTTAWLNDRSLDPRGGVRLIERVAFIDDTRSFFWWPERGHQLSLGFNARQTLRVDDGPPDDLFDVVVDAGWVQLWRLAHDHVLATSLSAEMVIPLKGDEEFRNLSRVGGIGGLSGYAADEAFGLAVVTGQLEYRHVYVNNLNLNLAHLAWLRSLGGVAFTGVATASSCSSYAGWFGRDSWYGHAGYAVMAYLSILGVNPQLFKVDVAVPLVRRQTDCLGETLPDYLAEVQGIDDAARLLPPFNVNVTFLQSF